MRSIVILWPQLTVHQATLGLSVAHTGIFSTVLSVSGIVPFLCGIVGDKIGNYKMILVVTTVLASVLAFLHTVVPSAMVSPNTNTNDITNITDELTTTTTTTTAAAPANATSSPKTTVYPEMLISGHT
ncbi:hypothetical protein O3P69_001856 [Scylla paramamosain]|uniref:Major facilitator superfamily associated domain-containing protein n=1 Tax=Scylla paramamosain TaxID=85552 RepID=A0AAW0V2C2_SCYPA